jgi:hypothetical protein
VGVFFSFEHILLRLGIITILPSPSLQHINHEYVVNSSTSLYIVLFFKEIVVILFIQGDPTRIYKMRFTISLILASTIAAAPLSSPDYNNLTVALVRAAPANWPAPILNKNWTDVSLDLDATITFAVDLITEAATTGANLVVFPETWFPG